MFLHRLKISVGLLLASVLIGRCSIGSVGDDYRCPLCGRVGNGGYAVDVIGYTICTEGPYSCLDKMPTTPIAIIANSIGVVMRNHRAMSGRVALLVASFLVH